MPFPFERHILNGTSMVDESLSNEVELMRRIAARDQQALSELYTQYGARVYGLCLRVLQVAALAEEATQDTFLKVWHQAYQWDPERGKLASWLLTIARYTAIDRLRKEKRQSPWAAVELEEVLNWIGQEGSVRPDWMEGDFLRSLIQQLPDDQIEAIELAFFKGLSHTEIAAQLDQPLGTIKSRIRNGLQTLRGLWMRADG